MIKYVKHEVSSLGIRPKTRRDLEEIRALRSRALFAMRAQAIEEAWRRSLIFVERAIERTEQIVKTALAFLTTEGEI